MLTRLIGALAALLMSFSLSGCLLFEKTADLRDVHAMYREEFATWRFPQVDPGQEQSEVEYVCGTTGGAGGEVMDAHAFAKTIAAMQDFRRKHPKWSSQELAHLDVLQGMIHLQCGEFGLAKLSEAQVEAAGGTLSGSSSAPRDALFARNYAKLVNGWVQIDDQRRNVQPSEDQEDEEAERKAQLEAEEQRAISLGNSGKAIQNELCSYRADDRLVTVKGDGGATYLAATAAIFYEWSHYLATTFCNTDGSVKKWGDGEVYVTEEFCTARKQGQHLMLGRDLVFTFGSSALRASIAPERFEQAGAEAGELPTGSLRYKAIYDRLQYRLDEIGQSGEPGDPCPAKS